jgi:hypothetical protein
LVQSWQRRSPHRIRQHCQHDYETLKARGMNFSVGNYTKPIKQAWGTAVTFKDADGNMFALVQPNIRQQGVHRGQPPEAVTDGFAAQAAPPAGLPLRGDLRPDRPRPPSKALICRGLSS